MIRSYLFPSVKMFLLIYTYYKITGKMQISPITGLEWPRGFQEIKVPILNDNGLGRW
jgi:hypothetical protein